MKNIVTCPYFFFFYLCVDTPPYTIFVVSGIQLDDASTETRLLLRNASLATSGRYKCEVSGGPPRSVQYSTVQYSTVQYSIVQYSTVQYRTVQYSIQYL